VGVDINISFWIILELTFFFGTLGIFEYRYRKEAMRIEPFVKPNNFVTSDEFDALISKG